MNTLSHQDVIDRFNFAKCLLLLWEMPWAQVRNISAYSRKKSQMTASWKCIVVVHNMIVTERIDNLPVSGCYRAWVTLTCLRDRTFFFFSFCRSLVGCYLSWTMIESCNYRTLTHMVAQCMLVNLHYLNLLIELCHFLPVLHEHITAVSWGKQTKMECLLKVREKDSVVASQTVIDGHSVTGRWMVHLMHAKWHSSAERKDCWVHVTRQMELQQTLFQISHNLQQLSTRVPNILFSIKVNVLEQCVYQSFFIQIKDRK